MQWQHELGPSLCSLPGHQCNPRVAGGQQQPHAVLAATCTTWVWHRCLTACTCWVQANADDFEATARQQSLAATQAPDAGPAQPPPAPPASYPGQAQMLQPMQSMRDSRPPAIAEHGSQPLYPPMPQLPRHASQPALQPQPELGSQKPRASLPGEGSLPRRPPSDRPSLENLSSNVQQLTSGEVDPALTPARKGPAQRYASRGLGENQEESSRSLLDTMQEEARCDSVSSVDLLGWTAQQEGAEAGVSSPGRTGSMVDDLSRQDANEVGPLAACCPQACTAAQAGLHLHGLLARWRRSAEHTVRGCLWPS